MTKHVVSISQFCSEFSELLSDLLVLPAPDSWSLVVYGGDFSCAGQDETADRHVLYMLESRDLIQRVDQHTS